MLLLPAPHPTLSHLFAVAVTTPLYQTSSRSTQLPCFVDEVRKLAVLLHDGRERAGDVDASDPAEPVGLIGQVGDLERDLLVGGQLDVRVNRVLAGLSCDRPPCRRLP